ncbi:ATP-dependent DNA helicase DinG [Bacillus alkalicellulosilyticus]|uniref:ATP-dependent DNA helicase DinG n=1 Tax=Alkalihalobacterium alkalicellulosilyticum TaxID=1912214 RepID=UPI000996F171|nr:ATP-dependent DNA helicase DinG [Bacillus alkalicellulosilyticus]
MKLKQRFVVIDLETTGQTPGNDRIIQIGAVLLEDGEITERFTTFVNPEIPIPSFIYHLTGITDEMVQRAPTFEQVVPELLPMLENAFFVAHNVTFDLSFLHKEIEEAGYKPFTGPTIDTVELARLLLPQEQGYKLVQLAEMLDIDHERPHQADSDAEVTAQLLLDLLTKLEKLPYETLRQLQKITNLLKSDIDLLLDPILRVKETTIQKDDQKFDIYREIAIKKRKHQKRELLEESVLFKQYKKELLQSDGTIAANLPHYEIRKGQEQMMDTVDEAFQEYRHALIEAGTGTGKSLGYLLPSLFYAKNSGKPVMISTQTIPLQEQLLERDIPLLKKAVTFPFQATVLKGRNHYLCLRKFEQRIARNIHDENYDTILTLGQLLVWITETDTGDVEELNLSSGGKALWSEVKSDTATCLGNQCPWFSRCYYQTARKNAQQADLVITNHALLFTDLVSEHALLPNYSHVVIDEAHHLEEVASEYLGEQSDYLRFSFLWNRLGTLDSKGLLSSIETMLSEYELELPANTFKLIQEKSELAKLEIDELFRMLRSMLEKKKQLGLTEIGRMSYRYKANTEDWSILQEVLLRVDMYVHDVYVSGLKISKPLDKIKDGLLLAERGLLVDFKNILKSLVEEAEKLGRLLLEYDPNLVYWMEADERAARNATFLYSKPIDISELLADQFFMKKKSVILTSATLTVRQSFSYVIKQLGLEDFGPVTVSIRSPFEYETKTKLLIPTDVPEINKGSTKAFTEDIVTKIIDISIITEGRMLILFTSYEMLRDVYYQIKAEMEEHEFLLIAQGIFSGSRAKLLKTFKQHKNAILFGTSSFWEGIDIPGEDLSCLVIVRLPFSPPDEPVIQARSEKLREEGKNPFMDMALPQAVLRFKQGFGRLIRTQNDRGIVVVFDKRIITTRYGSSFIQSLPAVPVYKQPMHELLNVIEDWL